MRRLITKMRDSEIEQWVLNEIKLMTGGRLQEICVWSLDGVVSLSGTVPSRADKLAIQKAAARGNSVVGVINRLNLRRRRPAPRRAGVKSQVVPVSQTFQF